MTCIPACFGGAWPTPPWPSCQLLGRLRDQNGRVTIPGFYDGVAPLTKLERQQAARYPLKTPPSKNCWACRNCLGNAASPATEQRSARPTLEINGLTSG